MITPVQWTLDVTDIERQAEFWSSALGYRVQPEVDGSARLLPVTGDRSAMTVWLQPTTHPPQGKNPLHLDFAAARPEAAIARLLELGARRCNVGQTGREGFVVLADPEGNEFCVFTEPRT
ncbi:MAG TPA: VOC family protein [Microlunatus sp.]